MHEGKLWDGVLVEKLSIETVLGKKLYHDRL